MVKQTEKVTSASAKERRKLAYTIRHQIKSEWSDLWNHRIKDKQKAEEVARKDYELLLIDRGTVIKATQDYKPPNLQEIYEKNEKILGVTLTSPKPEEGGWGKFSKEVLSKEPRWKRSTSKERRGYVAEKKQNNPAKKNSRGYLHRQ